MGTIVAVHKGTELCIAADAWNLMEGILNSACNKPVSPIIKLGESFIGLNSSYPYQQAFEYAVAGMGTKSSLNLSNKEEIRRFFVFVHDLLKSQFQLVPALQQGQGFELSPMNALVVNSTGIFKVDSARGVYEISKYWAIGTGEAFALGALYSVYNEEKSPTELAKAALAACASFDQSRGRDFTSHTLRAPSLRIASSMEDPTLLRQKSRKVIRSKRFSGREPQS